MTNEPNVFLVDTQADISCLLENRINDLSELNENNIIDIKGVTSGVLQSLGTVSSVLIHDGYEMSQEFHIVPNDFNIGADGFIFSRNISVTSATKTC